MANIFVVPEEHSFFIPAAMWTRYFDSFDESGKLAAMQIKLF